MRITYFLLLVIFTTLPLFAQQTEDKARRADYNNGIIAIVEDRIITLHQLRKEIAPLLRQIQRDTSSPAEFDKKVEQVGQEVLQNLIDRILTVNEFVKEGMQVPESYIENELDDFIINHFNDDRVKFLQTLRARGENIRGFRKELEEQLIVRYMRSRFRRSIGEVSPEKIERFYEENKAKFFQEESVFLKQIMLSPQAYKGLKTPEKRAQEIIQKLDEGADFSKLAREYSQDEKAEQGGEWGWINRSDIRQELANTAFELPKNTYSKPITLGHHIFILFIQDKREAGTKPLEEAREVIEKIILDQLTREAQKRWLSRLREEAHIKIYIKTLFQS